jgi:hypothetical protein
MTLEIDYSRGAETRGGSSHAGLGTSAAPPFVKNADRSGPLTGLSACAVTARILRM